MEHGQVWGCASVFPSLLSPEVPAEAEGCGVGCSRLAVSGEVSPTQHGDAPALADGFSSACHKQPVPPHTHERQTLLSMTPKPP